MSEVKRFGRIGDMVEVTEGLLKLYPMMSVYVLASDFDRVTAERDAALAELAQANEKIDKAWNRKPATDHNGFIPGAMDAWKRPVPQHLPYDFSGNPGASATQYCNGWNDSGSYWSAHAKALQQRLTAAEERSDVLVGLLAKYYNRSDVCAFMAKDIDAALKPAECCTVSAQDRALLEAGDYTPEELFGIGGKPSCPKCAP